MEVMVSNQWMVYLVVAVILQTAVIIQAQSISPLTTPHPVQATNSTVVITATASPPSSGGNWVLDWRFKGAQVAQAGYVSTDLVSAVQSSIYSSRITVSAVAMSASSFTTQLTIAQLRADEDGYLVELVFSMVVSQSIVLNIRDCNSSLPYDVIVDATSRIFNSPGKFVCSNGGDLFYSNGTKLTSSDTDTTCLASAKWSGQDNLQCWTAPSVTLGSNSTEGTELKVIEDDSLTLTCNYSNVIPAGDTSRFYVGGDNETKTKGEPFILNHIERSDNNKLVSCQAVTSYTDFNQTSGRSMEYILDVLYLSSSVVNKIETSQYVIESSESNYLLRSDQQLTMNCTPSDANPPATCSWQLCSDSRCQTLTSDGGCLITVELNASSNVACTAENVVGSISSSEQTVDVIPAQRQVQFNVTGSNVTNDGSINSTTYLGESIMISCSVSYENELSTTYSLKLPNNPAVAHSSIQFPSVSRFDTGGYICNTNDQFGNFNAAIYLNVIYAPQEDNFTTSDDCNGWYVGQSGASCSVVFYSNPSSQFVQFTKNDQPVTNDSMTIKSNGDEQTFEFQKNEVANSDNGTYTLTVQSSNKDIFPDNVQIIFHIIVADEPPPNPGLSIGAIIGIVCGCVVIILISVAVYVIHKRRKGSKKSGSQPDELYSNGNGNHLESGTTGGDAVHVNPAFKGDSEKELKINPIYASGGASYAQVDKKNKSKNTSDKGSNGNEASTSNDHPGAAYAQVDVTKKKKKKGSSEKEEKINPIYEAGDQPAPIEEAYAEVEKKKKNKKGSNEKEEKINPLYGSSQSPDQVEPAYAEVDKKRKKKIKKGSNEKEERINPLYGSSESPDQVEAAYAEVDKKKKKKKMKKGSSEKEEKLNPLYVSSDQPEPTEAAYAEVDKNKKKKQSAKEERINPLYEASSSQDQVEAAYAEVDKSKNKPKASVHASIQSEATPNATYAEVNKPKKKKKPPPPSRANTADATQVEESSNATYAEVNKPKKTKKPPSPSKENTAGGDGAYDDVDLHGSSSTKIDPRKLLQGISQRRQEWTQN